MGCSICSSLSNATYCEEPLCLTPLAEQAKSGRLDDALGQAYMEMWSMRDTIVHRLKHKQRKEQGEQTASRGQKRNAAEVCDGCPVQLWQHFMGWSCIEVHSVCSGDMPGWQNQQLL